MERLALLSVGDLNNEKSQTFVLQDEGHTFGNVLRSIISKYPDVEFCGYTVPHPAETKMYLRIQMHRGKAVNAFRRGLEDLEKITNHITETFTKECEDETPLG